MLINTLSKLIPIYRKYDFFRLRNELDRNQFLLGNDNEWIIPHLFKVFYSNTSSGVQSCGSIEPV